MPRSCTIRHDCLDMKKDLHTERLSNNEIQWRQEISNPQQDPHSIGLPGHKRQSGVYSESAATRSAWKPDRM